MLLRYLKKYLFKCCGIKAYIDLACDTKERQYCTNYNCFIMKKLLLILFSFTMGFSYLQAQGNSTKWYLVTDQQVYVSLTDIECMLFADGDETFSILRKDGGLIEGVNEVVFSTTPSGIADVDYELSEPSALFNPVTSHITLKGLQNNSIAQIFSGNGMLIMKQKLDSGNTEINVSNLNSGIYILKVNNTTLKFIKK